MSAMVEGSKIAASAPYETFAFLLVEEFLMKRNMIDSLVAFRQEWQRPDEFTTMLNWYDVALKLHIPEISGGSKQSVLENVVGQVVRDASVRSRRDADIVVTGLATLPRSSSLPLINSTADQSTVSQLEKEKEKDKDREKEKEKDRDRNRQSIIQKVNSPVESPVVKKTEVPLLPERYTSSNPNSKNNPNSMKQSTENWIPEIIRMKSLQRDLIVAKENFKGIRTLEITQHKELKRCSVTDLQRAHVEESLGSTKKIPCACCLQKFLHVNLPLKVSQKAIIDIRVKWSGNLNSTSIFEGVSLDAVTGETEKPSSTKSGKLQPKAEDRIKAIPRCYDEVRVCIFCAQFFHDQERYRPSYDQIVYEEKKLEFNESRRREREYWDPLKMIEKERDRLTFNEEEEALMQLMQGKSLTQGLGLQPGMEEGYIVASANAAPVEDNINDLISAAS